MKTCITHRAEYWGVLGTEAAVVLKVAAPAQARAAEEALFSEVDRLCAIFNRFDPDSELNRWQRGEGAVLSPELLTVLERAKHWQQLSGGAFHPGTEALSAVWNEAGRLDRLPESAALTGALAQLRTPWLRRAGEGHAPPPYPVNLNALAKGFIVDRAAQSALQQAGVSSVQLNIGGDLCHLGRGKCVAAVSDPRSKASNAPAAVRVRLSGAALASSGHTMRGRAVAGRWYSHLLDPRSGECVNQRAGAVAGASVIAPTCLDADALATALTVLDADAGLKLCQRLGYAALLTLSDGQTRTSTYWANYQVSTSLLGRFRTRLAV